MSEQERSCGNCRHWAIDEPEDERGTCQRYPPQLVAWDRDRQQPIQAWPTTHMDDVCGEWGEVR
jgi:hypothetical protein